VSHALKKLSPVLLVDAIEPCLPFWDRLGWVNVAEVPHGDVLGFVILVKDGLEVMYQTRASVAADIAALTDLPTGGTFLFLEVDDLDAVIRAVAGRAPRLRAADDLLRHGRDRRARTGRQRHHLRDEGRLSDGRPTARGRRAAD
jgi:hypothetical protein